MIDQSLDITPKDDDLDPVHAAMQNVFGDLGNVRTGVQNDLANITTAPAGDLTRWAVTGRSPGAPAGADDSGAGADGMALSEAVNGSGRRPETSRDQARRILSGQPPTSGDPNLDNAQGLNRMRANYDAGRAYMRNIAPYIPTSETTPEIASNNFNYLDLIALRSAKDPLADNIELGQGGSTVDERRARVQAMSDLAGSREAAAAQPAAEKNRLALIEAMKPISEGDSSRPRSADETMEAYLNAGGEPNSSAEALLRARGSQGNYQSIDAAVKKVQDLGKQGIEGAHVVTKPGGTYDIEIRPPADMDVSQKVQGALDLAQEELEEATKSGDQAAISEAQARVDHYTARMDKVTKGRKSPEEMLSDIQDANGSASGAFDASKPLAPDAAASLVQSGQLKPGMRFMGVDNKWHVVKGKPAGPAAKAGAQ